METTVVYNSKYYTVVKATETVPSTIRRGKDKGKAVSIEISTEGVARRSWKDPYNEKMGIAIATGRAIKAMKMKLENTLHSDRCRNLFMNG